MEKQIKKILKDLYKMDKYFKQNKQEVEQIVRTLIENKPDVQLDGNFVNELKSKLVKSEKYYYITKIVNK